MVGRNVQNVWTAADATDERLLNGIPWSRRSTVERWGGSDESVTGEDPGYSHSMVPGGLLVTSRVTRLTSGTSLVIRVEIFASRS